LPAAGEQGAGFASSRQLFERHRRRPELADDDARVAVGEAGGVGEPLDSATSAAIMIIAVLLVAACVPARRAARVQPVDALRQT
jgi:hypothetical protein